MPGYEVVARKAAKHDKADIPTTTSWHEQENSFVGWVRNGAGVQYNEVEVLAGMPCLKGEHVRTIYASL